MHHVARLLRQLTNNRSDTESVYDALPSVAPDRPKTSNFGALPSFGDLAVMPLSTSGGSGCTLTPTATQLTFRRASTLESALRLECPCRACRDTGVLPENNTGCKAQRRREGRGASVCLCLRRPCAVPFHAR